MYNVPPETHVTDAQGSDKNLNDLKSGNTFFESRVLEREKE